jgi:glycosyltransferase involved in cell wall biosynthesis
MGNNKKKNNNNKKNKKKKISPFVSICTPTFNRRPFIPNMFKCFEHQTYPKDRMEWIIVDDGTDKIEDLIDASPFKPYIKYIKLEDRITLGKKRNLMHNHTKGDIIVYMDDDDYYPPERISHAVERLQSSKKSLVAGSSEIYIWFKHIETMVQFGPYRENHATAGTFAFKRELLDMTSYDDNASLAEEKVFLKDYTIPMIQLEPKKTILVFSHIHNTFDKKTLLKGGYNKFMKKSDKTVDDFVIDKDHKQFYMNEIESLLENYTPGSPEFKPDVLKQIEEITKRRQQMQPAPQLMITNADGTQREANSGETMHVLKLQRTQIEDLKKELKETREQRESSGAESSGAESSGAKLMIENKDGTQREANYDEVIRILELHRISIGDLKKENQELKEKLSELIDPPILINV